MKKMSNKFGRMFNLNASFSARNLAVSSGQFILESAADCAGHQFLETNHLKVNLIHPIRDVLCVCVCGTRIM